VTQERLRAATGVSTDQHLATLGLGELDQGLVENTDVVARRPRRGRPGPQLPHQRLAGPGIAVVVNASIGWNP